MKFIQRTQTSRAFSWPMFLSSYHSFSLPYEMCQKSHLYSPSPSYSFFSPSHFATQFSISISPLKLRVPWTSVPNEGTLLGPNVVLVAPTNTCPALYDPMDCSPSGFSVHRILQARTLEWVAVPFSRGSSWPRDWNWVSCITGRFFTIWDTRDLMLCGNIWLML